MVWGNVSCTLAPSLTCAFASHGVAESQFLGRWRKAANMEKALEEDASRIGIERKRCLVRVSMRGGLATVVA
jgi:hypothetical protein